MTGTVPTVWHPTLWSWIETAVPAMMAVGGFSVLLRTGDASGWPAGVRTTGGVLLAVAGACWLFLLQPMHGP